MPAIRAGEKVQTIRLWPCCRMKAGQRSYIPGGGYIRVSAVEPVELAQLTDDDARPDGFDSADSLRAEITSLYGNPLPGGVQAYRVVFALFSPEEQAAAAAERKQRKAAAKMAQQATGG